MSEPTKNVKTWTNADFMEFITSLGIKGNNYNTIKSAMDDGLTVSDLKGSKEDFADAFGINKIVAGKIRKRLYAIRLEQGVTTVVNNNIINNTGNNNNNNNNNNNSEFVVNFRGKQGKMITLRKLFTANDEIRSVAQAYMDEECVNLSSKVEKILLQSGGQILQHDKTLGYYKITTDNNLFTVIFKTRGGTMPKNGNDEDRDRVIRFNQYGLTKTSLIDCLIGYDDDDGIDRALLCCGKHAMAAETMFSYMTSTLASNLRQKDIFCPVKNCGKVLDWQKCTQIADMNKSEYMKWTDILDKHRLCDMKQCPHCEAYCKRDAGVAMFRKRCIACNNSDWCWNCCQIWRGSGLSMCCNQNCSIIKETNQKLANCEMVTPKNYKYKLPRFRACPRCLTFIEYSEACKHMVCSGCDKQFCFVCLGLYDDSKGWPCGGSSTVCNTADRQQFK